MFILLGESNNKTKEERCVHVDISDKAELWLLTLAIRRTMSMKNWPKVSSKEKLAEVKGERERDSLGFAEDSIYYFPSVERFK